MQTATLSVRFGGVPADVDIADGRLAAAVRLAQASSDGTLSSSDGFVSRLPGSGDVIAYLADEDVDATHAVDYSAASRSARKQARSYLEVLRSLPGCGAAYLVSTGPQLGIRESRHMTVRRPLLQKDLDEGASPRRPSHWPHGRARCTSAAGTAPSGVRSAAGASSASCWTTSEAPIRPICSAAGLQRGSRCSSIGSGDGHGIRHRPRRRHRRRTPRGELHPRRRHPHRRRANRSHRPERAARTSMRTNPLDDRDTQMRLHVQTWGEEGQPTALLIHGLDLDSDTWWRFGPELAQRGFHVVAPDLRGHGRSPHASRYSPTDWANDIVDTFHGVRIDVAVGHSLGGLVSPMPPTPPRPRRLLYLDPAWRITAAQDAAFRQQWLSWLAWDRPEDMRDAVAGAGLGGEGSGTVVEGIPADRSRRDSRLGGRRGLRPFPGVRSCIHPRARRRPQRLHHRGARRDLVSRGITVECPSGTGHFWFREGLRRVLPTRLLLARRHVGREQSVLTGPLRPGALPAGREQRDDVVDQVLGGDLPLVPHAVATPLQTRDPVGVVSSTAP